MMIPAIDHEVISPQTINNEGFCNTTDYSVLRATYATHQLG